MEWPLLRLKRLMRRFETLGKPAHHTLANHWARVIEMVYTTERIKELSEDPELTSEKVREYPLLSREKDLE